jgi:hypothetical protein
MNSGADTLAGGFPHSEIRGSTIARISPQLIAACHVLHRLLAPRHPPNALIALITNHTGPHAGPSPTHKLCSPNLNAQLLLHSLSRSLPDRPSRSRSPADHEHARDQPFRFTCQTTPPPSSDPFWGSSPDSETCRAEARARPSRERPQVFTRTARPSRPKPSTHSHPMETVGIEPTAPCLQSRCSTTELRPQKGLWWAKEDLNLRPHAYQACALTN